MATVLTSVGVSACVIGGVAVALACGSRTTKDLDVVVAPTRRAGLAMLAAIDVLVNDFPAPETQPVLATAGQLAAGVEVTVRTSLGTLDVVGLSLPKSISRRALVSRRVLQVEGDFLVERASLGDLIRLKAKVARPIDLADVELLQRERGGGGGAG